MFGDALSYQWPFFSMLTHRQPRNTIVCIFVNHWFCKYKYWFQDGLFFLMFLLLTTSAFRGFILVILLYFSRKFNNVFLAVSAENDLKCKIARPCRLFHTFRFYRAPRKGSTLEPVVSFDYFWETIQMNMFGKIHRYFYCQLKLKVSEGSGLR